jgi:lysozyme
MPLPNRRQAAWCAIAVTCVSGFEGLRTVAYADPIGIPTICFGETKGVRLGDRASIDECRGMLASSLEIANRGVDACVRTYLPDTRRAALVSFTYNIGGQAFCSSTLVRKLNAGDTVGACNELSRWTRAKGIELPGLVKRRAAERAMCLQELT